MTNKRERILAKPTPEQAAWQDMEIGMFIHFGLETWQDTETDNFSTPLDQVNPTKLDTNQWVHAAKLMGAKYIVFVAKHAGGFCWWQTETTDYSVKNIPWRNGKGDVVRELSESCHRYGIKLGIYLSPQDLKHGAGVSGRCKTTEAQARYNRIYRQQLTELLSRYGEISEVWFDGSCIIEVGDILKKCAPRAMIFQSKYATIRWVGNERGFAPYPAWNVVSQVDAKSGVSTARHGNPDGDVYLPIECDTTLRDSWLWKTTNASKLKSLGQLMDIYYHSVGHGAVLLLNEAPDTSGLIPEIDMKRTAEFGTEIKRRFAKSIAETKGKGNVVELSLGKPTTIDHIIIMEDITQGERVREYLIEGLVGKEWKKICKGTAIGHKKIDRFTPVKVSSIRFRCTKSAALPIIRKLAVYYTAARPSVGAPNQGEASVYHKAGEWNPQLIRADWSILEIDITPYCDEATQYEVEFKKIGGRYDLEIKSVTFLHGGTESPEFVELAKRPHTFYVNITGIGVPLKLRALIRGDGGTDSYGEVLIKKRLQ